MVGIYILLVLQTSSFTMPLVIMVAIPLTMIGVMPGFALLNFLFTTPVKGFGNPIYFTATAMIGMIALAGIVVRNSIILIDFIHHHLDQGYSLEDSGAALGAVRFRPILLTALAAMFGSWVITLDPIFSGLAWSFVFGLFTRLHLLPGGGAADFLSAGVPPAGGGSRFGKEISEQYSY